jgi:hypothetical protein
MKALKTGAVIALCSVLSSAAAAKGKPQAIDDLTVDITGGLEAAAPVQSHEVSVSGGKNSRALDVVVRNFDITFEFGVNSGLDGFDTCFGVSDAGAAGVFTFDNDGVAMLEVYPDYLDKNRDPQLYQLILEGTHTYVGDVGAFPAAGLASFTADFDSIQVSTEGRGKRRSSCTGTFDSTDGFGATASFVRQ